MQKVLALMLGILEYKKINCLYDIYTCNILYICTDIANGGNTVQVVTVIAAVYDGDTLKYVTDSRENFSVDEAKKINISENSKIFVWSDLLGIQTLAKNFNIKKGAGSLNGSF